jgi:integrase
MSRTTGIEIRHARGCPSRLGATCRCKPTYQASVWNRREKRPIKRTFTSLSEAKSWRTDAMSALRKGTISSPTRHTLREVAEAWIESAKQGATLTRSGKPYKPSALRGYEADLRRYVLPDLGATRLSEIRRADIQELVDRLVADGHSASKVRNAIMPLRAIYRRPVARGEVPINPTTQIELPMVDGCRDRAASPAEAAELLDALPDSDRPLWATAFYAGLRRGELRALRWADIDLAANLIHVRAGWDDKEGLIEPKSKKGTRAVPIASVLRSRLIEYGLATGRGDQDFVFGSRADRPFTPSNVRKRALKAWETANEKRREQDQRELMPIGLHECRHTYVSLMFEAGLSLERIGDYVGHSSAYMTDRYRHMLEGHEAEAAKLLDGYLARSDTSTRLAQVADAQSD